VRWRETLRAARNCVPTIRATAQHVAVRCDADERQRLEQLCRTITRPALANERVQINSAGQVVLKLKTAWRDGTTHIVMSPLEFMQRLAARANEGRLSAGAGGPGTAPGAGARRPSAGGLIAARHPGLRAGPALDAGRGRRGALKRVGLPDALAAFGSGGGAAAAQCATGQPYTPPQLQGAPGEPVPVDMKMCRSIFLFTRHLVHAEADKMRGHGCVCKPLP